MFCLGRRLVVAPVTSPALSSARLFAGTPLSYAPVISYYQQPPGEPFKPGIGCLTVFALTMVGVIVGGIIGASQSHPNELLGDLPLEIGVLLGGASGLAFGLVVAAALALRRRWR